MALGPTELLIVLVIVIVLFGTSRIANIGRDLGTAMREFRKGVSGEEEKKDDHPKS